MVPSISNARGCRRPGPRTAGPAGAAGPQPQAAGSTPQACVRGPGMGQTAGQPEEKGTTTMQEKTKAAEQNQVLAGRNPVMEALRSGRELECVYIQSGSPKGPVAAILNKAREQGIPVKEVTREKLAQLSGIETHQGVAAICAAAAYAELRDIYDRAGEEPLFVVVCDNIEDPHNLGAIIRTAEACGAHGVIIPKRHSAGLTAAAVKSSAGAAVCLPVVRVANLVSTMQQLKAEKNVWFTCADMDGQNWCQLDFKGAVGLVIGSEGSGVSRLVREECDFVAALPMQGQINSLNASVAGGIILYEITRQRLGLKAK